ncbi:MAG: substrate-binding domain-containing protein [Coriobacteriia bacterium]|nr:substrate-binding domain-containing protein [Coriobacteriia bacterium]
MKRRKGILSTVIVMALAVSLCLAGCRLSDDKLSQKQAEEKLSALASKVKAREVGHSPDNSWVGSSGSIDELPDIDLKYPVSVSGKGGTTVEIFSSTEKSAKDGSGWLDIQAKAFNAARKDMSVSVRPIASGSAVGYITSGKHVPEAYTPSNVLWVEMLKAKGVESALISEKLTGNTAGILMKPNVHKKIVEKYQEVTIDTVVEAVLAGDLVVAHTDPNVSSTGLNIMIQELSAFDRNDPFGAASRDMMRKFVDKIPPVSPTTAETVEVANKGLADAILSEYQSWKSDPTLKDWVFVPMGVRHDSPLYVVAENATPAQRKVLEAFAEFCATPAAQASATSLGFNPTDGYEGVASGLSGTELYTALDFWKQNKDAGKAVLSVFVADRSGSMAGEPLEQLKISLLNGSNYINENHYVGMVSYANAKDITIDLPIDRFDAKQHSLFYGAVRDLEADGQTATNSALVVAMDMLVKKRDELGLSDAKLRIFLLSDGLENQGYSLNSVRGVIGGLNIPIYTIGYNAELTTLEELAAINEAYYTPAESNDVIMKIKELFTSQL